MTGFYRPTINSEGELEVVHAPNFVYAPTYTLSAEQHANKTDLPGGWEWHDDVPAWAPDRLEEDRLDLNKPIQGSELEGYYDPERNDLL